jgi:hypothetical protein
MVKALGAAAAAECETLDVLERAIDAALQANVPGRYVDGMRRLARQVGEPCLVATVGPVNAGKSSFLNALLEDDRAVVGTTETTATINYFSYGEPERDRPVRCHWRDGRVTEETEAFLRQLQGADLETLRRSEGIDHLEFLLRNDMLRRTRLVDTPGTGAAVTEHRNRTAEFLELERRVRSRHDAETVRIRDAADAIVYLTGPVALERDRELLSAFEAVTGGYSRPANALGVIAKIDLTDEMLARRHELAQKIAQQLQSNLNTVLPVSAGLARALQRARQSAFPVLAEMIDLVAGLMPEDLDLLLGDEELFCDYEVAGSSAAAPHERRRLRNACGGEWRVFATIARAAVRCADPQQLAEEVARLSGLEEVRATLDRHFLQRGHLLRCLRVARDARSIVNELRFTEIPVARRRSRDDAARLSRFSAFVRHAAGDPRVATDLLTHLNATLDTNSHEKLDRLWRDLDKDVSRLLLWLEQHDSDLKALQTLDDAGDAFRPEERAELRALLGLYGSDPGTRLRGTRDRAYCVARQVHWRGIHAAAPRGSVRRDVADRAQARLGLVIGEVD